MTFALAGVGYIAPKHLQAIKDVGGELIAACDQRDSVGILDRYFPKTEFFLDTDEFEEHIKGVDYLSICTPNPTHYDYIKMGERLGCKIICEKPLVSADELDLIGDVNVIQQLRLHPDIRKIEGDKIEITYITPRGKWYDKSWKYREGIIMNIGVHLFDLMSYLFGGLSEHSFEATDREAKGKFKAGQKEVNYYLSVNGDKVYRDINGVDLSNIDLHTKSYEEILKGNGFKKESVSEVIKFIGGA